MLATFRKSLNTLPARLFFMALAAVFVLWGVSGKIDLGGPDTSAGSVGGEKVQIADVQDAYRREVLRAQQANGGADIQPDQRRALAMMAAERLINQLALQQAANGLGVAVPDEAVRKAVFDVKEFQDKKTGQFDRAVMTSVLHSNGLSEQKFLDLVREQLTQKQVLGAVGAGSSAPAVLADQVFAIQQEKRVAVAVDLPLGASAPPPPPTDLQAQRWWANHPNRYSTPEYRKIKAILLAPQTLESEIQISEDDLKAAFDLHKNEYNRAERRSVQVILTQDEAQARQMADHWAAGADWTTIQDEANKLGAAPVELNDAAHSEFPAPELGDAVFATPEGIVPPPVHSALGWHVLKVTKVSGGLAQSLDDVRDKVRARVLAEKSVDLIYDRANRIENLLSSATTLDNLPSDLGVAALSATLDAEGKTPKGEPVAVTGPAELRAALLKSAFAAKPGDPLKLEQAPNSADGAQSFYALMVEDTIPPAPRPFAEVADQVRAEWIADQLRHGREQAAAALLAAVKSGQTLEDAAAKAGLSVQALPETGRSAPVEGFPPELLEPLFSLKKGEATMVETADGFVVAALKDIRLPDPKADPIGYGQVREALSHALTDDLQQVFATAVRTRADPRINQRAVENLATPSGGE